MIRVTEILPNWTGQVHDHVTLDYDARHRRRVALKGHHGLEFLLDLPKAVLLRGGDGLKLEDTRVVAVVAQPEALMAVTADSPEHLLRLAWHIGNRHLTAQIDMTVEGDRILIRHDHVIGHMLEHLGAKVAAVTLPFDPEGGAYGDAHQAHDHGSHDHGAENHGHDH